MLKIEKFVTASPEQWEIIIEGMRNPKNSWDRMDSGEGCNAIFDGKARLCKNCIDEGDCWVPDYILGPNDHTLMTNLANGGPVHAKYRRMIPVWVTLTAPLYWWKEFDTYKVGTVANSCSTMHKIHAKEFELSDFSWENLYSDSIDILESVIDRLNHYRELYLKTKDRADWDQLIQLLPTSYQQKRTIMLNYEVLVNIYESRKNHKLGEWHTFCDWIRELPYSELIIGEIDDGDA